MVSLEALLTPLLLIVAFAWSLEVPEVWLEDLIGVEVWAIAEAAVEVEAAAAAAVILCQRFSVVVVGYESMNVGYDSCKPSPRMMVVGQTAR